MTARTRRRVFFAVVVVALTLPVESILLRALAAPNQTTAAQQWAASLTPSALQAAAAQIEAYPFAYRRAIMTDLTPLQRAAVWQNHIQGYIQANPGLDPNSVALLQAAEGLATASAFTGPNPAINVAVSIVASQIQAALGNDVASYLLYQLGPPDLQTADALPIRERLANFVRAKFVLLADTSQCDCAQDFGCDGGKCDGTTGCTPVTTWPACGWFWNETCDGSCRNSLGR